MGVRQPMETIPKTTMTSTTISNITKDGSPDEDTAKYATGKPERKNYIILETYVKYN